MEERIITTEPNYYNIGANGTMVLEYTFEQAIDVSQSVEENKVYADRYLQPINADSPITFNLNGVNPPEFGTSVLRIGIGRSHGKSLSPEIRLNGLLLETPEDWKGYDQQPRNDFFGLLELPVSNDLLQTENEVEITFPDEGGHISTVTIQVRDYDHDPQRIVSIKNVPPTWAAAIEIYPNPTSEQLTIAQLDKNKVKQIRLYDLNGKLVLKKAITQSTVRLNTTALPSGIYQLQIQGIKNVFTKKLAIAR